MQKIPLLLTVAGLQANKVFKTFVFANEHERTKYDVIIQKLVQKVKLLTVILHFDLGLQESDLQLFFGIYDTKFRERLLRETEMSLNDAVKICPAVSLHSSRKRHSVVTHVQPQ